MKTTIMFLSILFICKINYGQINRYTKPIKSNTQHNNSGDDMSNQSIKAQALAIKEAIKEDINNYRQYYNSIPYFKIPKDGNYQTVAIMNNELKIEVNVSVINNRITSINAKQTLNSSNGLKVTSDIKNGYSKVFQEYQGKMMIIEIYFPDLYLFDKQ